MSRDEDSRFVVVVFGVPLVLVGVVLVAYAGVFYVPGGPCYGGGDIDTPDADVSVATNDSAVVAVLTNGTVGGETTDRVMLLVDDAESDRSVSREWAGAGGSLSRGDTFGVTGSQAGFSLTDRDRVTVRWYGVDSDVAGFCPNGRTFRDLSVTTVGNASTAVETS